jgi:hypothetical protein
LALLGLAAWACLAPGAAPAQSDEGPPLQPEPPWVFFPTPDEATADAIDRIVENSFADLNLVAPARAWLVERYGLWAVPRLARELGVANHEPALINAALTVAALRGKVGPAAELAPLVRPLISTARSVEEWRRAAGLLALGSFQGPEGVGRPRRRADVLIPLDPVLEARRLLEGEALDVMRSALSDQSWPVRCIAAFALAKTGGPIVAQELRQVSPLEDAAVGPRMALLLGRGFLALGGAHDHVIYVDGLGDAERKVRAAAALGAALQVVCDHPPAWTDAPGTVVRALSAAQVNTGKEDTAEAVFLRGCLAWKGQDSALWDEVLSQATEAAIEDQVASAAAQVLVACGDPQVRARALSLVTGASRGLHPAVLASLLLSAAESGTPAGVKAVLPWLANGGLTPRAGRDWDVRWHVVVGLARALAEGRIQDEHTRHLALEGLADAVRRGLERDAAVTAVLERALATHGAALHGAPAARLPAAVVRDLELACPCKHGILAADLQVAAVGRANAMAFGAVLELADLKAIGGRDKDKERDKEGTARRLFQRYLAAWPLFDRLDLLQDRGRRAAPRLLYDDPAKVIERGAP